MILTKAPDMSNVKWSKAQKAHRQRFKKAVMYAKTAMAEPKVRVVYEKMATKMGKRPFDMAVSDYFKGIQKSETGIYGMDYKNIITIEPGKRGGKPSIRGMQITVYDVLEYLASGTSEQEILKDFPYITKEDILASFGFAAAPARLMVTVLP